ncbi:unnamed protein product, partial [Ectocarpus sp. 8 AP-2014]
SAESGGIYGDTLSDEDKLTQIKAVKGCLAAGIPLNAMDNPIFRAFLSHCKADLPHRAHLAKYVPFILAEERKTLQDDIGNRPYAICFDATPWLAECFGLGVRFIDSSGKPVQRVLHLSMLKKSMTGADIAGEVNRIVTHQFRLDPNNCRAVIGDSCAANRLAIDSLLLVFRFAVVIPCFSHTFNNIGKQLVCDEIDVFLGKLHTLLSHSAFAKDLFRKEVGVRPPETPGRRWGSSFERDEVIAVNWPGVGKFVEKYESQDDTKSKAVKFMRDDLAKLRDDGKAQSLVFQLQLALTVDVGRIITSATIFLEGDMPLVLRNKLELPDHGIFTEDVPLPNVAALVAKEIAQGNDMGATADLIQSERQDMLDALRRYAHERIGSHSEAKLAETMKLFKAAKLTDFTYMKTHKYSNDKIRSLSLFPFVDDDMMDGLLKEKNDFYVAATDTDTDYDNMTFWSDNKRILPTWHELVLGIVLLQPSSAFMERVFSILRCCFSERQESVYSDRICASALLKYNRGKGK